MNHVQLEPGAAAKGWVPESMEMAVGGFDHERKSIDREATMTSQTTQPESTNGSGTRPRHIVCGVDGSEQARDAAIAALRLADRLGERLMLVHVTPTQTLLPVDSVSPQTDPSTYVRSAELAFSEAQEAFDTLSPDVTAANADREVRLGRPAVVLAEVAAEHDAELIVVGSRGRGPWRSAVLGSVSAEIARLAPCPVMIVPERGEDDAA